jgi:predicted nucleotide-binding protein
MSIQVGRSFKLTKFSLGVIEEIVAASSKVISGDIELYSAKVSIDGDYIRSNDINDIRDIYNKDISSAVIIFENKNLNFQIYLYYSDLCTEVEVRHPKIGIARELLSYFSNNAAASQIDKSLKDAEIWRHINVFIGHGRESHWRELKEHLVDKHDLQVTAYETGARAGLTIVEILKEMVSNSDFAILVFSAENQHADGSVHARENVIHEAGLFQGKLGFHRAIILVEEGCDLFTNISGIQYIRYSKGNIKETFGDVIAVIRREFLKKN